MSKQKLSPPRGCFRRKQARQLPFPATTPPVKKQLRNARRRFGVANKNIFSAEDAQSNAERI